MNFLRMMGEKGVLGLIKENLPNHNLMGRKNEKSIINDSAYGFPGFGFPDVLFFVISAPHPFVPATYVFIFKRQHFSISF